MQRYHSLFLVLALVLTVGNRRLSGAPTVTHASLRGLQIGGKTTLVVEGTELLPTPVLLASFPIAGQTVRPNPQPNRIEMEVEVPAIAAPGIFQVRIASGKGVSNPLTVGLDRLPQLPFTPMVSTLPVALHGVVSGPQILATKFHGSKGQRIVVDVESRRLGATLSPVVRIKDDGGRQLAWSPARESIAGDARAEATLPADGDYSVEFQDLLFRGSPSSFFRMKIGELHYADVAFPLGVQAGFKSAVRFAASNLPAGTGMDIDATTFTVPTNVPVSVMSLPTLTGSPPRIAVSQHIELIETPAMNGVRQLLPSVPFAVSGILSQPREEDQFAFPAQPGSRLRIEVFAQRFGSPLDGVLTVRNDSGGDIAANDDRPGNPDPGVEFQVPEKVNQVVVAVRDLVGRGGPNFVYRIEVTDAASPDFTVSVDADQLTVPAEATQTLLVRTVRTNYSGPIRLTFSGLSSHIQVAGAEIPAGATLGLVSFSAAAGAPHAGIVTMVASSAAAGIEIERPIRVAEGPGTKHAPWLRDEFAVAVAEPAPVRVTWAGSSDLPMLLGDKMPLAVTLTRAASPTGSVRLRLLTNQVMPRKTIKENDKDKEVDDTDRALRLDGDILVGPEAIQATANVIVPADLAAQDWSLALAADLLAADNKTVVATTTTPVLSKRPILPFTVELASASGLEARAGVGATGKLVGKLQRQPGFAKPVVLTLDGLPKEYDSPQATVAADNVDFEFPIRFAYGVKPIELRDIKLVARYQPDAKNAQLIVRSPPVAVGVITVVPGDPPPPANPLLIFEDDEKFLGYLSKGGGQISFESQDKYSGSGSAKVTPDQRFHETVPSLNVKVRENPAPGEYRFLRFAWKKKGGATICLQLNHDGAWGVGGSGKPGAKFRYHAGPGGECYGASVVLDEKLPTDFVVVTRDLFADFGEFTLTGIALSPVDGEYALFDQLVLARAASDFESLKSGK